MTTNFRIRDASEIQFRLKDQIFPLKTPTDYTLGGWEHEFKYEDGWCKTQITCDNEVQVVIAMPQARCAEGYMQTENSKYFKTYIHSSVGNPRVFHTTIHCAEEEEELTARVLELMALYAD
jgi:hypothetical protein